MTLTNGKIKGIGQLDTKIPKHVDNLLVKYTGRARNSYE
jgi:hypothetical protein